jgi:hypothetical protein
MDFMNIFSRRVKRLQMPPEFTQAIEKIDARLFMKGIRDGNENEEIESDKVPPKTVAGFSAMPYCESGHGNGRADQAWLWRAQHDSG